MCVRVPVGTKYVIVNIPFKFIRFMCGSRGGGAGGPDPLKMTNIYRVF